MNIIAAIDPALVLSIVNTVMVGVVFALSLPRNLRQGIRGAAGLPDTDPAAPPGAPLQSIGCNLDHKGISDRLARMENGLDRLINVQVDFHKDLARYVSAQAAQAEQAGERHHEVLRAIDRRDREDQGRVRT